VGFSGSIMISSVPVVGTGFCRKLLDDKIARQHMGGFDLIDFADTSRRSR
jgi:hypothetical protein